MQLYWVLVGESENSNTTSLVANSNLWEDVSYRESGGTSATGMKKIIYLSIAVFFIARPAFAIDSITETYGYSSENYLTIPCVSIPEHDTFHTYYYGTATSSYPYFSLGAASGGVYSTLTGGSFQTFCQAQPNIVFASSTWAGYSSGTYYMFYGLASVGQTYPNIDWFYVPFVWDGISPYVSYGQSTSSSYIGSIVSPQPNGMTTASTSVNFSFNYFVNVLDGYTKVGLELNDVDGNSTIVPVYGYISGSGLKTFTATSTFEYSHYVWWRPYLENASSTKKYGVWQSFYVVSASTTNQTLLPIDQDATSSIMAMLNVPNLLKTRVPFAYIFQIAEVISDTSMVSSSSVASLTLNFVSSSSPYASQLNGVAMFSTSTITSLMGSTNLGIMRALLVAITYVGSGLYLFRYVKGII